MKNIKKIIAVMFAILLPVLACNVGYADESEKDPEVRALMTDYDSGTYNNRTYSLDARQSSSSLIKSTGTYAVTVNMSLYFTPWFVYTNSLGQTMSFHASAPIIYGAYSTASLTKSYTVGQAGSYYVVNINGEDKLLSIILSADACFSRCNYQLRFDTTAISNITVIY